jgi:methionyl-tRNA formyltransferase
MSELKIILLCSSRFALPAMWQLSFLNQLASVAIPVHCEDMIAETKELLKNVPVPVIILNKAEFTDQLTDAITKYEVNAGLVMTFSYMIPDVVYNLPAKGFFNVHPGPLPAYRGADPIFQQIKNRENYAAVTIHKIETKADSGAIVLQERIPLLPDDTHGLLDSKLSQVAAKLTGTLMKIMEFGFDVPSKPQDETKAHYFKRQGEKDITIDWENMEAASIVALINACNPWNKGAVAKINNKIIRLAAAEVTDQPGIIKLPAGTIISIDEAGMQIAAINGEAVTVGIICIDEGLFLPGRLKQFGLAAGIVFERS